MLAEWAEAFQVSSYTIPLIVVGAVILAIGGFVLSQNSKSSIHRSFFSICVCVTLWQFSVALVTAARDPSTAVEIYRTFTFLSVAFIAPIVYRFSLLWLNIYSGHRGKAWLAFLGSTIFYLLAYNEPNSFSRMHLYAWGYFPQYGIIPRVFVVYFFSVIFAACYNFIRAYLSEPPGVRKTQIRLIATAFFISFIGSVDYIPKLTHYAVYPLGFLCVFTWIMIVGYSIIRYRVMDIQTAIHKTIMWFLASSILGAPLIVFYTARRDWVYQLPREAFLALIIATFVMVVLYTRHVQPAIDHFFQRRQWDLNRALERFTEELVHLRSLEEVVAHIVDTVKTTLYLSHVSLVLRDDQEAIFKVASGLKAKQEVTPFGIVDPFLEWLENNDTLVQAEYLTLDPNLKAVAQEGGRYFQHFNAPLAVPLVVNQRLVGILNIGQKQNFKRFRSPEISFLSDFRRAAAIAVSNSLHLIAMQENLRRWNEELEKKVAERTKQLETTQAQLIQAEKLATMGNLAGGVAHEINNPLTAVLTNAQILKMTANAEDLESVQLIEEGAKRCQIIIQSLLKYARKSQAEAPHAAVNLHEVIRNVCSLLQYQLRQENIEIVLRLDPVEAIEGVSNELEQVLTNLVVNARDAIRKVDRPGRIAIETRSLDGQVELKVTDNGHGMSKEILGKIFDPFFTTKDVGAGTGLGLAVTHSIMEKHRGRILVESAEGTGTTFLLQFPVAGRNSNAPTGAQKAG